MIGEGDEQEMDQLAEEGLKNELIEEEDNQHPFDRMMFGSRTNPPQSQKNQDDQKDDSSKNSDSVNLEELLTQIDTLMESAKQLKPMFSKIRPFFTQFLKK
ncbi:hypothetical protein [Bacillus sp. B15-48]|uniref:hypothetical protein n=1 Tax=Bacillus sp. B15-48 TaxID=1548601 RepID=UPI00193F58EF|nr:hypothetical protein [Bacillus sp. B15-48]MBM4764241.1 hypothetical protein [Bacillus sp. B15-48]